MRWIVDARPEPRNPLTTESHNMANNGEGGESVATLVTIRVESKEASSQLQHSYGNKKGERRAERAGRQLDRKAPTATA